MRVLREGRVRAGDRIVKTTDGPGALSVADTDALLYLPGKDRAKLRAALRIPALSPGWQGSFRDLLAGGDGSDGSEGAGRPAWAGFRALRVQRMVPETAAVTSIYLAAADGTTLPPARPGQYLALRVTGAGQPAPVRSYSLSAPASDGTYRISVKREPHGAVSGYLNTALQLGATLEAAAPRGEFVLGGGTGPVLLVSAGIGITPVLAMLHELAASGSEREVWWIHAARRPQDDPLAAEAHALLASLPRAREHLFYSSAGGRLSPDRLLALGVPPGATAYICGPATFMPDMEYALTTAGLDPKRIRTELFGSLPPSTPGIAGQPGRPPHPPDGPPGTGPLVTFARSGLSVPFSTARRSVLELADACDVPVRWSCRTGVCGTCVTPLLSGEIGYRPDPLEQPTAGQVLICCAQPRTDIVLDL
jgi:ferredoxin-NADP reductase